MSRPSYYGRPGGLRNPFGSSGKKPRPLVLPALPTTEHLIRRLEARCQQDYWLEVSPPRPLSPWGVACLNTWCYLSHMRQDIEAL